MIPNTYTSVYLRIPEAKLLLSRPDGLHRRRHGLIGGQWLDIHDRAVWN